MVAISPNAARAVYCDRIFSTNTSSIFSCTFHFSVARVFCLSYLKAHEKQSHCACFHTRFGSVFFSLVIATLYSGRLSAVVIIVEINLNVVGRLFRRPSGILVDRFHLPFRLFEAARRSGNLNDQENND